MTVLEKIRDKESGSWSRVYAITTTTIIIIILIMIIIMRIEESIEGEFNVWFQV